MRWTLAGANFSSERMKPGACEHASLTVTTMVMSRPRSAAEQAGYFGFAVPGFLGIMQFLDMMTSGTSSPTWCIAIAVSSASSAGRSAFFLFGVSCAVARA